MSAPSRTAARARLASVAAALALLASLAIGSALEPSGARAMGPLPACRYDDILTTPRAYGDWPITLVDTILRVPDGYVPPDLVATSQAGIGGGGKVRAVLIDDLRELTQAAAAAGNPIGIESAYRSYAEQQTLFGDWVKRFGYERALEIPARPGHSEHQLGVAIDFRSEPDKPRASGTWGSTPAGTWMAEHAWTYGFVMSYPKGRTSTTCYDYEPWHFRYVGRDLAARIHASGLTIREFLWASFTTTVVPMGKPPVAGLGGTAAPSGAPLPSLPATTPGPSPTAARAITPPPATPAVPSAEVTEAPPTGPAATSSGVTSGAFAAAAAGIGAVVLLVGIALGARLRRRRVPG